MLIGDDLSPLEVKEFRTISSPWVELGTPSWPPRASSAAPTTALTTKLHLHKELVPLTLIFRNGTTLLLTPPPPAAPPLKNRDVSCSFVHPEDLS